MALFPFASVTVKRSVNEPLAGWVTMNVPVPPYGPVPPVADIVHENGLPAVIGVPVEPQVTLTTNGCWTTVTCVDATAVLPLASPTLNDSVNVPLTGCVTLKVPVPW